jgi:hypothetical protein
MSYFLKLYYLFDDFRESFACSGRLALVMDKCRSVDHCGMIREFFSLHDKVGLFALDAGKCLCRTFTQSQFITVLSVY